MRVLTQMNPKVGKFKYINLFNVIAQLDSLNNLYYFKATVLWRISSLLWATKPWGLSTFQNETEHNVRFPSEVTEYR